MVQVEGERRGTDVGERGLGRDGVVGQQERRPLWGGGQFRFERGELGVLDAAAGFVEHGRVQAEHPQAADVGAPHRLPRHEHLAPGVAVVVGAGQHRVVLVTGGRVGGGHVRAVVVAAGDVPVDAVGAEAVHDLAEAPDLPRARLRGGVAVDEHVPDAAGADLRQRPGQHELRERRQARFLDNRLGEVAEDQAVLLLADVGVVEHRDGGHVVTGRGSQRGDAPRHLRRAGHGRGHQPRRRRNAVAAALEDVLAAGFQTLDRDQVESRVRIRDRDDGQIRHARAAPRTRRTRDRGRAHGVLHREGIVGRRHRHLAERRHRRPQRPVGGVGRGVGGEAEGHRRRGDGDDFQVRGLDAAGAGRPRLGDDRGGEQRPDSRGPSRQSRAPADRP